MNTYYIVYEKRTNNPYKKIQDEGIWSYESYLKSWMIRNTNGDLDTAIGLREEIAELESELKCTVLITYYKKIKGFANEVKKYHNDLWE